MARVAALNAKIAKTRLPLLFSPASALRCPSPPLLHVALNVAPGDVDVLAELTAPRRPNTASLAATDQQTGNAELVAGIERAVAKSGGLGTEW